MEIGKTIRTLRITRGIKQREVASSTGLTITYLSLIETKNKKPSLKAIKNIAAFFEMTPGELIIMAINPELLKDEVNSAAIQLIIEPIINYFVRPE